MSLAVLGRQSLDDLERMIIEKFSGVRPHISESDAAAIKYLEPVVDADKVPDPFPQTQLGRLFHVVPVNDIRSLRLFFPLPPVKDHYRSLPTRILSNQLGHEAAGSILALLKERGWATNLSAGVDYSTQTFASFGVTVTLSELGLQHCSEIVALVFRYIELMRNQSDSQIEEARSELAAVAESTFQYKGIEESSSYVTALSKSLHDYAPEHVLSGDRLWFESRTDLTRKFLNSLRADNCNIFVVAKSSPADRTEHWFGTPYSESTIPEAWMCVMQDGECCPQLHLPKRNPFVATDFSIVVPKQTHSDAPLYHRIEFAVENSISVRDDAKLFDAPAKVFENDRMCVWHKPDDRFSKPKCTVVVKLWTSAMQHEPMSQLCSQLLLKMIDDSLDDIAYDASLASLHSSIDDLDFALKFSFSGFSHKLPELLHEVFARFMSLQLQPERLIPLKERLGCALRNFSKQQPQEHAGYFRQLLLSASSYHLDEKLALLDSINVEQLEAHRRSLLQQAHMDCFAYGNIEAPAALKLFQKLDAQVRSTSAPLGLRPTHWARMHNEQRTVQLPDRSTVYHRVTHTNADDKNSATSTSWQVGPNSRDLRVRMQLLSRMLRAPIFAQLRTREQLGYLVSSGVNIQHGVLHFVVTVQSDHQSADYLQQRIDACVHACRESVLLKTTPSEWETNRASLVQSLYALALHLLDFSPCLIHIDLISDWKHPRRQQQRPRIFGLNSAIVAAISRARLTTLALWRH
jgi:insulysin